MNVKHESLWEELNDAPVLLRIILRDADNYCQDNFGKQLTLTRILEPVSGETGVHQDFRAADCRDEYNGRRAFTSLEVGELLEYINAKYYRNDGFMTLVHHSFQAGPYHFHFQIAVDTKTYMTKRSSS